MVRFAFLATALLLIVSGPPLSGARPIADRAEIRRDMFGVPHILAEDEEAAAFAFGYAMAEDHAAEVGRRYLQARGEAARHFGPSELESDLAMHRLDNRAGARRALGRDIGRRFRQWLVGFAAGVNHYVAMHRDGVPAWMPVVEPSDPLAYSRMFGVLSALQPPSRLVRKYSAPVLTARAATSASRNSGQAFGNEAGSAALALSGSKTTSGRPILLGNPHLRWSFLYWEAHVTVPGRINFYGSTLAGIPVLRAGFNDRLGYVQTNNAPDLEDIYALPLVPERPGVFLHRGRERQIERRHVAVEVKQLDGSLVTEQREYEETALGPVVYRTADQLFAVRSINLEWWRQYEGFFELMHARSLADFRRILRRGLVVSSNYTYADVDGNILYLWNARLPRRPDPDVDYELDVPGDTPRLFWKGIHRYEDLPWLLNPPGGYLQNANNPPWWTSLRDGLDPVDYPAYIERGQLSLRAQAVLEALDATPRFSPDDVRRLKFTSRSVTADRLLPDLFAAAQRVAATSEPLRAGLDTLAAWDRQAGAGSRGAVLFERFVTAYEEQHLDSFATPWDPLEPTRTPRGLGDPDASVAALERAVVDLRWQYGSERVAWGEVNRFRFGDIDLPGDGTSGRYGVFRVIGFDEAEDGKRVAGHAGPNQPLAGFGDAWVLMVHFARPVAAWSILAYGQTTSLDSPHSRDQIRLFASHTLRPVWFSENAIAANLERAYRPGGAPLH